MFIILSDHLLVSDMYWQMAWHAICWYMYSYLVAL